MWKLNGDAERYGLKQGDLSTKDGRTRLYDRLLVKQPRDIWMSPRCKAWCRWNQFNMSKNAWISQTYHARSPGWPCAPPFVWCFVSIPTVETPRVPCSPWTAWRITYGLSARTARRCRASLSSQMWYVCCRPASKSCHWWPVEEKHPSVDHIRTNVYHARFPFGVIKIISMDPLKAVSPPTSLAASTFHSTLSCTHDNLHTDWLDVCSAVPIEMWTPLLRHDDFALTGSSNTDLALHPTVKRRRLEEKQTTYLWLIQRLERENQVAKLVEMARGNYAPRVGKSLVLWRTSHWHAARHVPTTFHQGCWAL